MPVYRQAPSYEVPITNGKNTSQSWYRWIQSTDIGTPPSNESGVALTGSPFTYTAPAKGFLIVHGGTVTATQFTRNSTYTTGQTQGTFPLSQGDKLAITYSVAPVVTWVPQ